MMLASFSLLDLFTGFGRSILGWLSALFNAIISWLCEAIDSLMLPLVNALPDLTFATSFLVEKITLANRFFALDYAVFLFGAWCVFCLSVALINWILGLIPTVN